MDTDIKNIFITHYNQKVPDWKKISEVDLISNKSLDKTLDVIKDFIVVNNLDPKRLVYAIVNYYSNKNKKYPNVLLFKGESALSIYRNYILPQVIEVNQIQEISLLVKKSKELMKNMQRNGIVISKGVRLLEQTGKADPYFLLAYGLRDTVPKQYKQKWDQSDSIKSVVLDILLDNKV